MKKLITKNKITILIISIIILITVVISSSYALYYNSYKAEETNTYETGSLKVSYENGNVLILSNNVPLSDPEGVATDPYIVTIVNKGNLAYKFNVLLMSSSGDNIIDPNYIRLKVNDKLITNLSDLSDSVILKDVILKPEESLEINLRVWLEEFTPNSEIGKTFTAKLATDGQSVYKEID